MLLLLRWIPRVPTQSLIAAQQVEEIRSIETFGCGSLAIRAEFVFRQSMGAERFVLPAQHIENLSSELAPHGLGKQSTDVKVANWITLL